MKKIPSWTLYAGIGVALISAVITTYLLYYPLDVIDHNEYAQSNYGKGFVCYFFFMFFLVSAMSLNHNLENLQKNSGKKLIADITKDDLRYCFYGNDYSMKLTYSVAKRKWLFFTMLVIPLLFFMLHAMCVVLFWFAELFERPIDWIKWNIFKRY